MDMYLKRCSPSSISVRRRLLLLLLEPRRRHRGRRRRIQRRRGGGGRERQRQQHVKLINGPSREKLSLDQASGGGGGEEERVRERREGKAGEDGAYTVRRPTNAAKKSRQRAV